MPNSGIYLGVDPGASGGLAWITSGGKVITACAMPDSDRTLLDLLNSENQPDYCVIEKVNGYIGMEQPGSAMFNFGVNVGKALMALTAAEIPFEEVMPQKWQSLYSMKRKKGEAKGRWKNRLKEVAQRLFPDVKVTLSTSDALLLAEYARRIHLGNLSSQFGSNSCEEKSLFD